MEFIIITTESEQLPTVYNFNIISPELLIKISEACDELNVKTMFELDMVLPIEKLLSRYTAIRQLMVAIRKELGVTVKTCIYSIHHEDTYYGENGAGSSYGQPTKHITV